MTRGIVLAALLLGGCTWSNSLYRARHLSDQAISLERNDRPFEAATLWGQAAVKADTAYARNPHGVRGAEALWLKGRALARSGGCTRAIPSLESALTAAPAAKWREDLELILAQCLDGAGDPRALQFFERLERSTDPGIRVAARSSAGHAHVALREWNKALESLRDIDTPAARLDRAIALAGLQRLPEAMAELQPMLVVADTLREWRPVVQAFAAVDGVASDTLIARLQRSGSVSAPRMSALHLAAAQGAARANPEYADRRLRDLVNANDRNAATQGRLLIAERLLARTTTPATLTAAVDSLKLYAADEGSTAFGFNTLARIAETIAVQYDSVPAGATNGDLLTFLHGEIARDSLGSPELSKFFFMRLERDWPLSPYVAKGLLARIANEPDSADALRARLLMNPGSPYVAYLQGEATPQFTELELALLTFAQSRRARGLDTARPRPATQGVPTGVDVP